VTDTRNHTTSCLDERAHEPARQAPVTELATVNPSEALRELALDMEIKATRAAEQGSKMGKVQNEIQNMLDERHVAEFGHESSKYSPLLRSPSYSPLPDDEEQHTDEQEEKDFTPPRHSNRTYPPTRKGIDPLLLYCKIGQVLQLEY